ncbi:MAG: PP2C family protein-serine/threonine phosphatase [Eubacteriales bacterium]|nr:PP2C family protein-serine/threonine phosphatase [Eubacteriales bacterium]
MLEPFEFYVSQAQALGARDGQEDAMAISSACPPPKGILAVLSDGMGGMNAGERYSAIATEEMIRCFEQTEALEDPCQELLNCYAAAQRQALLLQEQESGLEGGATVTALLIRGGRCAYLSVGDSRIYLYRSGALIQLNREQSLGVLLDEQAMLGYMPKEEAQYNLRRKSLTNHLGMDGEHPCDRCLTPIALAPRDRLLLMSDGVFGTLEEETIEAVLRTTGADAAQKIIDRVTACAKPRQDNSSVMCLEAFAVRTTAFHNMKGNERHGRAGKQSGTYAGNNGAYAGNPGSYAGNAGGYAGSAGGYSGNAGNHAGNRTGRAARFERSRYDRGNR